MEGQDKELRMEKEQEERHKSMGQWMAVEVPRAGRLAKE